MPWNAAIICEGETEIEAVGSSPDEAVLNMLADIMEFWRKDEWTLCGDYIKEIGEAIVALERADKNCEFESQCGDFAAPWKLVVTWIEPAECDQIGSGCTCESCQSQLSTALGMMEPVDLDPRIPDAADDCKPNANCLKGVKCPKCGQDAKFGIAMDIVHEVTDDGVGDHIGELDWSDDSYCECRECWFSGKFKDFVRRSD